MTLCSESKAAFLSVVVMLIIMSAIWAIFYFNLLIPVAVGVEIVGISLCWYAWFEDTYLFVRG